MSYIPHGKKWQQIFINESSRESFLHESANLPFWQLTSRQMCDLELILNGGFNPLNGFLDKKDYESVLTRTRLNCGWIWPMPITLDVDQEFADIAVEAGQVVLCDPQRKPLGLMQIKSCWLPDKKQEAEAVYGTVDEAHPAVDYLFNKSKSVYLGGPVTGIDLPKHYDFPELRLTPKALRNHIERQGWDKIVAFQTRNPMHRAHQELTIRAARDLDAALLIHPVVGMTKPGDIESYVRVRCYQKLMNHYPAHRTALSLLPLAMRMAGPREALWHALIRKNYGATHFIVGRDHAGPGNDSSGKPFYGPYDAQEMVASYQTEIGIEMVPFKEMVYSATSKSYKPRNEVQENEEVLSISGTEFRRKLRTGEDIPEWFSYSDVISELRRHCPPRAQQGFTIFLTGLSGAGKSTIASALSMRLRAMGKNLTLLDGDEVRNHLSSELGFSKEHRDLNIRRIGFVAQEITRHNGIAICAPIAPYISVRREVRQMVESCGGFIEVYVSTPLDVCEKRDPKGLYKKARQGVIKGFTGIDDPYEAPQQAEVVLNTATMSVESSVEMIISRLEELGYLVESSEQAQSEVVKKQVVTSADDIVTA